MEIKTENVKELSYNELINTKENIECGDIILIKEKDSGVWDTQFVTLVTGMGIYLHLESDGLDGGGIIVCGEKQNMYDNTVFIHIPIKKE